MGRFYRIDEANARLTELRPMLEQLRRDRDEVAKLQAGIRDARQTNGSGEHAEHMAGLERQMRRVVQRMERTVNRIDEWEIALRDIGRGLVDFPALANGRPIWLCWRLGEGDIGWWHDTEHGFDDRRRLSELS